MLPKQTMIIASKHLEAIRSSPLFKFLLINFFRMFLSERGQGVPVLCKWQYSRHAVRALDQKMALAPAILRPVVINATQVAESVGSSRSYRQLYNACRLSTCMPRMRCRGRTASHPRSPRRQLPGGSSRCCTRCSSASPAVPMASCRASTRRPRGPPAQPPQTPQRPPERRSLPQQRLPPLQGEHACV